MFLEKYFNKRDYIYFLGLPGSLFLFLLISKKNGLNLSYLVKDISTSYNIPVYSGLFSTLGIFLWVSTFSICILTLSFLSKNYKNSKYLKIYKFSSSLNFIFLFDDQFLIHERNGLDLYFYLFYSILLFLLISKIKKLITIDEIKYLISALLFFFLTTFIDVNPFELIQGKWIIAVLEDMLKIIGIYFWLIFFAEFSLRILKEEKFISKKCN